MIGGAKAVQRCIKGGEKGPTCVNRTRAGPSSAASAAAAASPAAEGCLHRLGTAFAPFFLRRK